MHHRVHIALKCKVEIMARKRFEFWLNDQRQEDWLVYELIGKLKKPPKGQGQFTRAIREGLRLWTSLRDGQVDVLLELFPWVREALTKSIPTSSAGGRGQLDEIKSMLELIASQQQSYNGYLMQSATAPQPSGQGNIRQLAAPSFAMPVFEDDDQPTVLICASTSTDSSMNFVSALRNMQ